MKNLIIILFLNIFFNNSDCFGQRVLFYTTTDSSICLLVSSKKSYSIPNKWNKDIKSYKNIESNSYNIIVRNNRQSIIYVSLFRNGKLINRISNNSETKEFEAPITLLENDVVEVNCEYLLNN